METMHSNNFGVIMAGGVGSRFWPMSKSSHPKQFMDILGTGKSLLQQSFDRLTRICSASQIYIVTNEQYREITLKQLPSISADQVLCEPERRNTAPCIAYACMKIAGLNSDAAIVVTPSDHLIQNETKFENSLVKALTYASQNNALVTIGIHPSRPDTGYGYIHYNKGEKGVTPVLSFTEKPDLEKAKDFMESGDYSWNSGMFIWSASAIQKAFQRHLPEMYSQFEAGKNHYNTSGEQSFVNEVYPNCENISIDYGIMEKADNAVVLNADFGWSDLGTWGSLYEHIDQDKNGNAPVGDVMVRNSNGNIIHAPKGKLIVLQGLDDFIVVDHEDTLLICKKEEEQQIKQIVEELSQRTGKDFT